MLSTPAHAGPTCLSAGDVRPDAGIPTQNPARSANNDQRAKFQRPSGNLAVLTQSPNVSSSWLEVLASVGLAEGALVTPSADGTGIALRYQCPLNGPKGLV